LVKDSSYTHFIPDKNLNILYFEIEKIDGTQFTLAERRGLSNTLKRQIQVGFEKVAPMVFMRRNEEEVHKTILTLSREIHSLQDIPQAWISLERQVGDEIIFVVVLVYVSPKRHFPIHQQFGSVPDCTFISERVVTVRHLLKHPVEAHVFRLHLNRSLAFVRSDGSLDFYASRQKVVSLINAAIGEFRDYNGGGIIKQRELLDDLKGKFPWIAQSEPELLESFFYEITPLEQQTLLATETLGVLFQDFLNNYAQKLPADISYALSVRKAEKYTFISVQTNHSSWKQAILNVVDQPCFSDLIYSLLDIPEGLFFHGVLPKEKANKKLVNVLQKALEKEDQHDAKRQFLRIGMEYGVVSLDPRVSVDFLSKEVLSLLFEGLTRIGENGLVKNGLAETIEISEDRTQYIFRLRKAQWNNGETVKASDFEYAWKKALSSRSSHASVAYFLYHIENAKAAQHGQASPDDIGIIALDERTLKVTLEHPAPYFLELTAMPIFYPVHQQNDQDHPQWPYQTGHSYPCNGPFQLVVNDSNLQTYRLAKNPNYWDSGSVLLDEILLTQTEPQQALQMFRNGQLDWVGNPFGGWHDLYTPLADDRKIILHETTICWLLLNTRQPPLNHPKVRRALELTINREALVEGAAMPIVAAYSLLEPGVRQGPNRQDIELAEQLLSEGLSELGLHINNLPVLELMHYPGGVREEVAQRLAKQLHNHLGIKCLPKPMPWSAMFSKMTQGEFQISLVRWNSPTYDPITAFNTFRYAQDSMNVTGWEHPKFQQWLYLSDQEINPAQRSLHLKCAEQVLTDEAPVILLFREPALALVKQSLETLSEEFFDLARSYRKAVNVSQRNRVST
jgi:oligopeptide transport system substrate-binding protein